MAQSIDPDDERQETLALLEILALAEQNIKERKTVPLAEAMQRMRDRIKRNQTGR
jgi:hypothetical protein